MARSSQVEVAQVSPAVAAQAMRAAGLSAPLPCDTPEGIAAHGQCFSMRTDKGLAVFVLRKKGEVLWVDGAACADGFGLMASGLALAEEIAQQSGCTQVAFETSRRGLVRASEKAGFEVAGYIIKKAVPRVG